ncbi:hypothetical protein [Ammoniphilus resinae]|uniref:Uncharacterized protein n=1 Tax=Ammoniphilus resinae TaxID=861532 RepID=A0ABS4GN95_9BACL|nr:hypothetical protein [Ammoniphilus resinae]MBP1931704.1 hypothetical protein [Ammoniphilus resinae]
MLSHYLNQKVSIYYSDGTKLCSHKGTMSHYDAKHNLVKMLLEDREVIFPLTAITKIEVKREEEFVKGLELDELTECYEHRGHDFW